MNETRRTAHRAYSLAKGQLETLRRGDFDGFAGAADELEATYAELLRTPMAEFDEESRAVTQEVVQLQRDICRELDELVEGAAGQLSSQRRKRAVSSAYRMPGPGPASSNFA